MDFEVVNSSGSLFESVSPTIIKVIGCGGGGSNAVRNMIEANIQNIDFIALNTDLQALNKSIAKTRLAIGQKLTQGLGAGGDPLIGEKAAEEDKESISNALRGANMVFVTAGMGGGTGTGSAPIVAKIAKEMGALTVAIVTTPFEWEGPHRAKLAEEGLEKLRMEADSVIVIPNSKIIEVFGATPSFIDQLRRADDLLRQAISGMAKIVTSTGAMNIDFADVKRAMENQKTAIFGIGIASGENRASDAANQAIKNPLLEDLNTNGAKHILINIVGSDPSGPEVEEISRIVNASASSAFDLKTGIVIDESMGDELSVTVIATGFGEPDDESEEGEESSVKQDDAVMERFKNESLRRENVFSSDDFSDALSGRKVSQNIVQDTGLFYQDDYESEARPDDYGSFGKSNWFESRSNMTGDEGNGSSNTRRQNLSRTINFNRDKS